jgi:hypothetical protein
MELGGRYTEYGIWYMEYGIRKMVYGIWNKEDGIKVYGLLAGR